MGKIRSAGVTDLRFRALLDEDWRFGAKLNLVPCDALGALQLAVGKEIPGIAAIAMGAKATTLPGAPASDRIDILSGTRVWTTSRDLKASFAARGGRSAQTGSVSIHEGREVFVRGEGAGSQREGA
jgi:hypothetical protein